MSFLHPCLNIGLTAGLIGQRLFSVLVLMAVLTTVMTAPCGEPGRPRRPARCGTLTSNPRPPSADGHTGLAAGGIRAALEVPARAYRKFLMARVDRSGEAW